MSATGSKMSGVVCFTDVIRWLEETDETVMLCLKTGIPIDLGEIKTEANPMLTLAAQTKTAKGKKQKYQTKRERRA